jgi:hypothetical protein
VLCVWGVCLVGMCVLCVCFSLRVCVVWCLWGIYVGWLCVWCVGGVCVIGCECVFVCVVVVCVYV